MASTLGEGCFVINTIGNLTGPVVLFPVCLCLNFVYYIIQSSESNQSHKGDPCKQTCCGNLDGRTRHLNQVGFNEVKKMQVEIHLSMEATIAKGYSTVAVLR